MKIIVYLVILISLCSCKQAEKEPQLKETEKVTYPNSESPNPKAKEQQTAVHSEVAKTILHCENKQFSVIVDQLKNGTIRYRSWDKPKSISDEPNLVVSDGTIEQQGTGGGYHYVFNQGDWSYIVENKLMGETMASTGIFLKVLKNGVQKLYSKMNDLTVKKNYDLTSYSKKELIGDWWTPHYALRTLSFSEDGIFIFDKGDGEKHSGTYTLTDTSVSLNFDNQTEKTLKIGGGKNHTSLTLNGEGENFIKKSKD